MRTQKEVRFLPEGYSTQTGKVEVLLLCLECCSIHSKKGMHGGVSVMPRFGSHFSVQIKLGNMNAVRHSGEDALLFKKMHGGLSVMSRFGSYVIVFEQSWAT